jgi:hypothetical protein
MLLTVCSVPISAKPVSGSFPVCRQYSRSVPASACIEVFAPLSLPKHKVSF